MNKMTDEEYEVLVDHILKVTRTACVNNNCLPTDIWCGASASRRGRVGVRVLHNVSKARLEAGREMRRTVGSKKQGGKLCVYPDGIPAGWAPVSFPTMGKWLGCCHSTFVHAYNQARYRLRDSQGDSLVNSQAEATA